MLKAEHLSKVFIRTRLEEGKDKKGKGLKKKSVKEEFYAVKDISLKVGKGEILGILGPNGAGKTTLLRMLGTLMEPTDGRVVMEDAQGGLIEEPVEMKKNIGYLSGNTKLYHRLSTREMLQMLEIFTTFPKRNVKNGLKRFLRCLI